RTWTDLDTDTGRKACISTWRERLEVDLNSDGFSDPGVAGNRSHCGIASLFTRLHEKLHVDLKALNTRRQNECLARGQAVFKIEIIGIFRNHEGRPFLLAQLQENQRDPGNE